MQIPRGRFLSSLIVGMAFAISIATFVLLFDENVRTLLGTIPNWFNGFLVVFLLARLSALMAIWKFQRWGLVAFFVLECGEVALGLFVFTTVLPPAVRIIGPLSGFAVLLVIWFLALRTRWRMFS